MSCLPELIGEFVNIDNEIAEI